MTEKLLPARSCFPFHPHKPEHSLQIWCQHLKHRATIGDVQPFAISPSDDGCITSFHPFGGGASESIRRAWYDVPSDLTIRRSVFKEGATSSLSILLM